MKKLMLTAAVAAMTAGAFAGVAQVYDMTINVKTTECKDGKKLVTDKCGNDFRYYRNQTSYKFEGKFWGCGCATIANPIAEQYGKPRLNNGLTASEMTCEDNNNSYMFWGKNGAFHQVDFVWNLLQLVGSKSANVEGTFAAQFFICDDGELVEDVSLDIVGAGYGTANIDNCKLNDEYADYDLAFNQIKSMNGNVVGIYNVADAYAMVGCSYCGDTTECAPFQFCNCIDLREKESAAYGTFTLKFNSSLANKVANGKYIDQAYKFKDFVTAEFACIDAGEEPEEETRQDKAVKAYKAAKVAQEAAAVAAKAANEEVTRLNWASTGYDDLDSLKDGKGTTEGLALYTAMTNGQVAAAAALVKAQIAYDLSTAVFSNSFEKAGGDANDASELVSLTEQSINATYAYTDAKEAYDTIMADPDATAAEKQDAKEALIAAESEVRQTADALSEFKKQDYVSRYMTATVTADYNTVVEKFTALMDARLVVEKKAYATALNTWLSENNWIYWQAKTAAEGTQHAAYLAAVEAATKAAADLSEANEDLENAKLECVASGAECF